MYTMLKIYILSSIVMSATLAQPAGLSGSGCCQNEVLPYDFTFFTRAQWAAREPKQITPLKTPVSYVTIHHSYTPAACYGFETCANAMREMQNMHMDDNQWWDIGYSFAVGSDGAAYEGRGWESLGAHAKYFNSVSFGICLIGDWTSKTPPANQIKTAMALIEEGVKLGYIKRNYKLVGHRQVRNTECPGEALFHEIKTWPQYTSFPAKPCDLLDLPEIADSVKEEIRNNTMCH